MGKNYHDELKKAGLQQSRYDDNTFIGKNDVFKIDGNHIKKTNTGDERIKPNADTLRNFINPAKK